jgi:hypothetical protein
MKNWGNAETVYKQALKIEPNNGKALDGLRYVRESGYVEDKAKAKKASEERAKYYASLGLPPQVFADSESLGEFFRLCVKNKIKANVAIEYLDSQQIHYVKKDPGAGDRLTVLHYRLQDRPRESLWVSYDENDNIHKFSIDRL